ncbi:CDGSH iron-sulfur domain-containing protein [Flagellatimonas centrodinii]|uniref:CDGSH iron-sulfur domain-containing protein n=1 Tax=Flagellatimonas centrodinii TaxID=2806210 RepID=UPI003F4FE986
MTVGPRPRTLVPGDYLWCGCGRSGAGALCDGRDAGNSCRQQRRFTVTPRSGTVWLCECGRTGTPPWCDGRHNHPPNDSAA